MFGIGFSEIALIVLIAIVVLGPKESVHFIKKAAKAAKSLINYRKEIESSIQDSIDK